MPTPSLNHLHVAVIAHFVGEIDRLQLDVVLHRYGAAFATLRDAMPAAAFDVPTPGESYVVERLPHGAVKVTGPDGERVCCNREPREVARGLLVHAMRLESLRIDDATADAFATHLDATRAEQNPMRIEVLDVVRWVARCR